VCVGRGAVEGGRIHRAHAERAGVEQRDRAGCEGRDASFAGASCTGGLGRRAECRYAAVGYGHIIATSWALVHQPSIFFLVSPLSPQR
jgi:hypothetical protein